MRIVLSFLIVLCHDWYDSFRIQRPFLKERGDSNDELYSGGKRIPNFGNFVILAKNKFHNFKDAVYNFQYVYNLIPL